LCAALGDLGQLDGRGTVALLVCGDVFGRSGRHERVDLAGGIAPE
jgi:hypothetical protein